PWSNGKYIIKVMIDNETYYGILHVLSKNITEDEFTNMHKYLEEQLQGITKKYTHLTQAIDESIDDPAANQLEYWLINYVNRLISILISLENNYVTTLKKNYQIESLPKHLDRKSIQWATGAKGSIYGEKKYYNRKYKLTANSRENQYVKKCIMVILKTIKKEQQRQLRKYELMNNRVNDAKRRIEIIEDGIRKSANKRNISKEDIYKRKLSKQNAERELKAKEEKRKSILMTYYKLKKGFQKLNYLMNNTFWKYVKPSSQNRDMRFSNKHYGQFYKLWRNFRDLCGNSVSDKGKPHNKTSEYVMISTPTLYEYYSYFKLIDILHELGFKQYDQSKTLKAGYLFSEILPNTVIQFEKESFRIDLVYDQEVHFGSTEAIRSGTYFFCRSAKRRPDIRIDLYIYDKQFNEYIYHSSMILEVKYRPLKNIYSEVGYTEEMYQLNGYRVIRRYCPFRESFIHNVREIICVYPGDDKDISFISEAGIYLILRPNRE